MSNEKTKLSDQVTCKLYRKGKLVDSSKKTKRQRLGELLKKIWNYM